MYWLRFTLKRQANSDGSKFLVREYNAEHPHAFCTLPSAIANAFIKVKLNHREFFS